MMQAFFHGGPFDGDHQLVNIGPLGARPTRQILPSPKTDSVFYVYKLWVESGTRLYYRYETCLEFDHDKTAEVHND